MIHKKLDISTQDDRGTITDIFYKQPFEHITIIETPNASVEKPVIRGNHFHKISAQSIFMVSGRMRYWYRSVDESVSQYIEIGPYDLVSSPPLEIHALEILEPTTFIAFSNGLRGGDDYESDTYRVPSIIGGVVDVK